MRRLLLAAALCIVARAGHAADVAPLHEEIATHTYDIRGDSAQRLAAAINVDGPIAPWGQHVAGYTTADIHWWLRMIPDGEHCRLANAEVRLVATITSPRWIDAVTGPVMLRRRWPVFLAALARHEATHLQLMREAAEHVRAALAEVTPAASCDALEAAADDAAVREVRTGATRNREFDARTRHGRTEGVDLGS